MSDDGSGDGGFGVDGRVNEIPGIGMSGAITSGFMIARFDASGQPDATFDRA